MERVIVGVVYESDPVAPEISVHEPPGTRTCHFFVRVAAIVPYGTEVKVAVVPIAAVTD
jgi:hypothetical protein